MSQSGQSKKDKEKRKHHKHHHKSSKVPAPISPGQLLEEKLLAVEHELPIRVDRHNNVYVAGALNAGSLKAGSLNVSNSINAAGAVTCDGGTLYEYSKIDQLEITGSLQVDTGGASVKGGLIVDTLSVTGLSALGGQLDMTGNKIVNVATPTLSTDAANKAYVDQKVMTNFTPNTLLEANASGVASSSTTMIVTPTGGLSLSGGLAVTSGTTMDTLKVTSLTPSSFVSTDANNNLVSGSITNFVDLTSVQTLTGQKTLNSPILNNPMIYDAKSNLVRGTFTATLAGGSAADQVLCTFANMSLPSTYCSTYSLELLVTLNDPNMVGGIYSIPVSAKGLLYTTVPTISITDSTGSLAAATAVITSGQLTAVNVTATGKKYTNPTITLSGGGTLTPGTLGTPLFGNVFWSSKYVPIWNISSTTVTSSTPTAVLQSIQAGNTPPNCRLFTKFSPGSGSGQASISVMFNTASYPNSLSASIAFTVSTTNPV
ncbi:MAG: hypothetical protein Sylvanvirus1_81 [Sylvanvirus sp.]|uniref:Uncharacterized protein n=1 Tax=Sylvanvirus sp. TaxID=2487774 RepID=A0A3G5AH06_9VIRU|nr:MAG: hypothetical protein Sylvanvirus1_81 [Sylvanvirus sp.]